MVKDWHNIVRLELELDGRTGCGGQLFVPHQCMHPRGLPLDVNEVLIPKSVFQKLPKSKQRYFYHKYNCELCCRAFHQNFGHSKQYRRWFMEYVSGRYGGVEVANWLAGVPLKLKRGI